MKFGDNLRNLRKKKKISQESLAEKVGVSRQSVSKWECGDAYPNMDNIFKLCDIFHCKINDLIHEELTDINSLDEDVKMSIVKLKREKQNRLKGLSKAIYIIARVCKALLLISVVIVAITMIATLFISRNIKAIDNVTSIYENKVEYEYINDELVIKFNDKVQDIQNVEDKLVIKQVIDTLQNHSIIKLVLFIEVAFTVLIATLILFFIILNHLEKLFVNIHNGETPFTMENVSHIKKMAIFMIIATLLPNVIGITSEIAIGEDLGIGFELLDFVYILFLFTMAYIFEYGYEIQLDSKGKMYGDENE